ncbi:MAG: FtsX-like permease family protein [Gemmatimonadetes bacterium]|nr:FtsX-like permease family protein [Gemmatimonadota bacterium]
MDPAFGGDSTVVGRRVLLNGVSTEVVGVMPPGYGFPVAADSWVPLGSAVREATEPGRYAVSAFGRLADGATREQASQELETLLRRARSDRPPVAADSSGTRLGVLVRSFPMAQMGDEGPYVFGILNLMAVLILLLACVNVANLLLARANERSRELAVRLALGASRARLAIQALWEPVALVTIGGGLATALAAWGAGVVNRGPAAHGGEPRLWGVGMDTPTIIAAGGFMTVTIAALGGVMAVRATSTRFSEVLRDFGDTRWRGAGQDGRRVPGRHAGGDGDGAALLRRPFRDRRASVRQHEPRLRHDAPPGELGRTRGGALRHHRRAARPVDATLRRDVGLAGGGARRGARPARGGGRRERGAGVRRWTHARRRRHAARLGAGGVGIAGSVRHRHAGGTPHTG